MKQMSYTRLCAGTLPPTLLSLPSLESLDINSNKLVGELSATANDEVSNLHTLNLANNDLRGAYAILTVNAPEKSFSIIPYSSNTTRSHKLHTLSVHGGCSGHTILLACHERHLQILPASHIHAMPCRQPASVVDGHNALSYFIGPVKYQHERYFAS